MPTRQLASARRNANLSALIARRAVAEARRARPTGTAAVSAVVLAHQAANAQTSRAAVAQMLLEQEIDSVADAILDLLAFTSDPQTVAAMLDQIETDFEFDRLVDSLVQDAGRAAESVAVAVRADVYHVRYVNPPCCGRCAVLAGRVYRWSDGFQRHPGCDCAMIPTTVAGTLRQDPEQLVRDGLVSNLSKADTQAVLDGADLGLVVNVRRTKAGLREAGYTLTRGGRPTPAGIYRMASDREHAVELLRRYGYVR